MLDQRWNVILQRAESRCEANEPAALAGTGVIPMHHGIIEEGTRQDDCLCAEHRPEFGGERVLLVGLSFSPVSREMRDVRVVKAAKKELPVSHWRPLREIRAEITVHFNIVLEQERVIDRQ